MVLDADERQVLRTTGSICPECYEIVEALLVKENGGVWIEKECKSHGRFRDVYWSDWDLYHMAGLYKCDGGCVENPKIVLDKDKVACPKNCGLCRQHMSHTLLGNIFLTNRCELGCWYCFANAARQGFVYEPTFEEVRFMLRTLRMNRPVPTYAVQFTGGEPTLRGDLLEIIRTAKEMGFLYILLNTNGLRIAKTPGLAQKYAEAGVNILYLSFDGVTEVTNPKNIRHIDGILDEMRKARISVTLVPTIIGGINDHEVGDIIDFAVKNKDVVHGVNFQPVSFVGRMKEKERMKMRVTIPDLLSAVEKQTGGRISRSAFYPPSVVESLSNFIEAATGVKQSRFTSHPYCGVGTYVMVSDDGMVPINDIVDVDAFCALLNRMAGMLKHRLIGKIEAVAELCKDMDHCTDRSKMPKGFDLKDIIAGILRQRSDALVKFHDNMLFIGTMHFQDAYNYDIERVKRCVIHYAVPDGRIIPFCSYNVMPELYRDKIHKLYGVSLDKWKSQHGKELDEPSEASA